MHLGRMHAVHVRVRGLHMRLRGPQVRMLRFPVPAQVDLSLERSAAQFAGEWFEAGVLAGMGDQVGTLAERFPADLALVGLLACGQGKFGLNFELYIIFVNFADCCSEKT